MDAWGWVAVVAGWYFAAAVVVRQKPVNLRQSAADEVGERLIMWALSPLWLHVLAVGWLLTPASTWRQWPARPW